MSGCTCNPNPSGIHHYTCPASRPAAPSVGWICPSCNRSNAPTIQTCACSKSEDHDTPRRVLTELA